jgi:hypothetical protein
MMRTLHSADRQPVPHPENRKNRPCDALGRLLPWVEPRKQNSGHTTASLHLEIHMTSFVRIIRVGLMVVVTSLPGFVTAEDTPNAGDRFAGEAQIVSQPPLPIHLDLRRAGDVVEGTFATPIGAFELLAKESDGSISGRYGGEGDVTLVIAADGST